MLPEVVERAIRRKEISRRIAERATTAKESVRDGTPEHGYDVLDLARRIQSNGRSGRPRGHYVPSKAKRGDSDAYGEFPRHVSVGLGPLEMEQLERYASDHFCEDAADAARRLVVEGIRGQGDGRLVMDNEIYSMLLSSIKNSGTGLRRVLSPAQCAKLIRRIVEEEGDDAAEIVLPLAASNIRDFVSLLNLPEDCQGRIIWGRSYGDGVVFSSAVPIAELDGDRDKHALFEAARGRKLTKQAVRRIIRYHRDTRCTIEEAVRQY